MNYATLAQLVQDFAVDAEPTFVDNIPNFVRATEKRVYNDVPDLPSFQTSITLATVANTNYITAPDDFLSVDTLAIIVTGERRFLISKTPDFLQHAYPVVAYRGVPRYYAVDTPYVLRLAPVPDAIYTVELSYLAYPESIVDAVSGTSWLGDNFEFVLQYGALRDAAVFLKEEADVVQMYETQYAQALAQLKDYATMRGQIDFRHRQDFKRLPR